MKGFDQGALIHYCAECCVSLIVLPVLAFVCFDCVPFDLEQILLLLSSRFRGFDIDRTIFMPSKSWRLGFAP